MNEIAKLIKNYNTLLSDLNRLNNDISELISEKYGYCCEKEVWEPKMCWTKLEKYYSMYFNKKEDEVFYICFYLQDDCPFLLLERMYDLKNTKAEDFSCRDVLVEEDEQVKNFKKLENNICSFDGIWGDKGENGKTKILYAKISLLEITSQEIVQTEIKSVIDCLLGVNNKFSAKTIKLI